MLSSPTKEKPSSPSSRHSQPTTPSTDRLLPSTSTVDQQPSSPAIPISSTIDPKTASSLVYNGIKLADANTSSKTSSIDLYAWQLKATHFPLYKQLQTARKTLTTHDWMLARDELKAVKTIQRIEALKKKNGWSLRQLKRHKAPPRAKTHWDSVLDEMKWMQTDFKEERKWKIAVAYMLSKAVMEWHWTDDKSTVCIKVSHCHHLILSHETNINRHVFRSQRRPWTIYPHSQIWMSISKDLN